jgi:hypothetical protein
LFEALGDAKKDGVGFDMRKRTNLDLRIWH